MSRERKNVEIEQVRELLKECSGLAVKRIEGSVWLPKVHRTAKLLKTQLSDAHAYFEMRNKSRAQAKKAGEAKEAKEAKEAASKAKSEK